MKYKIGDVIITKYNSVERIIGYSSKDPVIFKPLINFYYITDKHPWGIWEQFISNKIPTPEEDEIFLGLRAMERLRELSLALDLSNFKVKSKG